VKYKENTVFKLVFESEQKFEVKSGRMLKQNHKFEQNDRRKQITGFKKKKSYKEKEKDKIRHNIRLKTL
jgi:hypothetical protein